MWYEIRVQLHSFAGGYPVVPAPFVEKTTFPPSVCLGTLGKDQLAIGVWPYFWTFSSIPLIYSLGQL